MAIASGEDLLRLLRQQHLIEPAQLDRLVAEASLQDPHDLARRLVRQDWLTPFQVNCLFQGKGEALCLGSYVLLEKLGEGGMGTVYKARNWKLGQTVALKLIRKEKLATPQAAKRFLREVRASAAVSHPHIVHALDADEVGGTCFLVMEYVPGVNLHQHIHHSGPLPIAAACEVVRQTALALQCLSETGLVHRDVKPGNLLLTGSPPRVKLLDLGLASLGEVLDDDETALTREGQLVGTPDFVAPEQIVDARTADIRSDLYSLGCTFYFLLTGRVPFPDGTLMQKFDRHRFGDPAPLSGLRADVPVGVAAVVCRLMAKRPEDRFQRPAELVEALDGLDLTDAGPVSLGSMATRVMLGGFAADTVSTGGPTVGPAGPIIELPAGLRRRPRRRLAVALAGLILLLLIGVIAWLLLRPGEMPIERPVAFAVSAEDGWQDSGIDVMEDEEVTLVPSGVWRKGQEACSAAGLQRPGRSRGVAPDAPYLCLLARIGDEPTPRSIPQKQSLCFGRAGRLYFRINDLESDGHSGVIKVQIDGGTPGPEVTSPPPTPEEKATALLDRLRMKLREGKVEAEQLFREMLTLRGLYGETWHGRQAGVILARERAARPSPLDRLDAQSVPAEERQAAGALPDLVGVLGSHRQRHWGRIHCLAVSRDGKLVASGGRDAVIRLWDGATLKPAGTLTGHTEVVNGLAFMPKGRLISCSDDRTVRVWAPSEGKMLGSVKAGEEPIRALSLSGDGRTLATLEYSRERVRLWEVEGDQLKSNGERMIRGTITEHTRVTLSPKGSLLAVVNREQVQVWDMGGKNEPRLEIAVPESPWNLVFAPDGRTLVVAANNQVNLWDVSGVKAALLHELRIKDVAHGLDISSDGKWLAAACSHGRLEVWDLSGAKPSPLPTVETNLGHLSAVRCTTDNRRLVTGSDSGLVRLWDLGGDRPREAVPLDDVAGLSTAPAFSPDGLHLAYGRTDGGVCVWDLSNHPVRQSSFRLLGGASISSVSYFPDGRHVLAAHDTEAHLLRTLDAQLPGETKLLSSGGTLDALAIAPDLRRLAATTSRGRVLWWDLSVSPPRLSAPLADFGPSTPLRAVAFSADAKTLVTGLAPGKFGLWDMTAAPPRLRREVEATKGAVLALAFSPDGESLVSAPISDFHVSLWDMTKQTPVKRGSLPAFREYPVSLTWSPDGERLYTLDARGEIVEWRGEKLQRRWSLPGPAFGLDVSPDGRLLAVSNTNGTIYLLRLAPPPRP